MRQYQKLNQMVTERNFDRVKRLQSKIGEAAGLVTSDNIQKGAKKVDKMEKRRQRMEEQEIKMARR